MPRIPIIVIVICLTATGAVTHAGNGGHMIPLSHEKLPSPIRLARVCDDVTIVEWRATPDDGADTRPDYRKLAIIKHVCEVAVNRFEPFLTEKYPLYRIIGAHLEAFDVNLCLIPDNAEARSLNDTDDRFAFRSTKDEVWGYHHRAVNHIYLTNEAFIDGEPNPIFEMVLAHDIFHALSYNFAIFAQHPGSDPDAAEEQLAREFTKFLGEGGERPRRDPRRVAARQRRVGRERRW